MKISMEEKKQEALKRLGILKKFGMSYGAPIRQFRDDGEIGIFENQGGFAKAVYYGLYMNTGDGEFYDKLAEEVKKIQEKHDLLVYLILVDHTNVGTICSLFYVSDQKEEWGYDIDDLENGCQCVYGYNMDIEDYSEFGSIAFEAVPAFGGICRKF